MYYSHGLTQKEVAEQLNLSRTTVIRLLDEAVKRGEVRFWIEEGEGECVELAVQLERVLNLDEAIVVPAVDLEQGPRSIGLALGKFLSEAIPDNVTVGVGCGRTLTASLASFRPPRLDGVKIVSLLGGAVETRFTNSVDYTWRLASALGAECYLFPAPLIVDSSATKRSLVEDCGLDRLYALAENLDIVVLSVGDIGPAGTSLARNVLTPTQLDELVALGCVGDVLCNFFDKNGDAVPHPIYDRVMSIGVDQLSRAGHVVIASGGAARAKAMLAAIRRIGCNTLVTDEPAARALIALAGRSALTPAHE
jgi:DNA-binding transcriptional regulator LsrR (DeoR family)